MIRRINLFAGPCSGKSSLAAHIFSEFKKESVKIELVQEEAKEWAYEGRKITKYDQLTLFAAQMRKEDLALRNGSELIVSDSPIMLAICYAKKYGFNCCESLYEIAKNFEEDYPSINIFLERNGGDYQKEGRYETYIEALHMDFLIKEYLIERNIKYNSSDFKNWEKIMSHIRRNIREKM